MEIDFFGAIFQQIKFIRRLSIAQETNKTMKETMWKKNCLASFGPIENL